MKDEEGKDSVKAKLQNEKAALHTPTREKRQENTKRMRTALATKDNDRKSRRRSDL